MSEGPETDCTRRALLGAIGLAVPAPAALAADTAAGAVSEYGFASGITYLNTASLGPTPLSIRAKMDAAWIELERNPVFETYNDGPLHLQSDQAREEVANLLGCRLDELLITRSTTDAMNILASGLRLDAGDRVLLTDQEHEGGTYCWTNLARRRGVVVDTISIAPEDRDPETVLARFARAIRPRTKVVSVSHIISATGYLMPIERIASLARANNILCVVDGAQAFGQIPVDVRALGCHAYAAPGHKWLMGPKGTGVLYVHPDAKDRIEPVQLEAGHRFVSNSTGVGCLPLCIGFGAAAAAMRVRGMAEVQTRAFALRSRAYEGLSRIPRLKLASGPPDPTSTALVAAYLPDTVDSATFRDALQVKHQLIVKMTEKRWFNGFRLSPHIFNDEDDVDRALRAIRLELA